MIILRFIIIILLLKKYKCTEITDKLISKNIKIFISALPDLFLGEKLSYFGDCPFESTKLGFNSDIDTNALIRKDGKKYNIRIGEQWLCANENKVLPCTNKPNKWEITLNQFGYSFEFDEKCLTFIDRRVELSKCINSKNQIFDFILIPDFLKCLEDFTYEEALKKIDPVELKKVIPLENIADKIIEEMKPVKNYDDFVDRKFTDPEDKKKAEAVAGVGSIWSWWSWPSFEWPAWDFLHFACPFVDF